MPKFKVNVTVRAERTYEVEIEATDESKAEDLAAAMWRSKTEDFDVDKVDSWETEAEQLTWECVDCSAEVTRDAYHLQDERCVACFAKLVREDARTCQHAKGEDCMTCASCGHCDETLDDDNVCDTCRKVAVHA